MSWISFKQRIVFQIRQKIEKERGSSYRKNEEISGQKAQTHGSLNEMFQRSQMSFLIRRE